MHRDKLAQLSDARAEVSRQALELPELWPNNAAELHKDFHLLDLDRIPGYAVVLAIFQDRSLEFGNLEQHVFWQSYGAWLHWGSCGRWEDHPLRARFEVPWSGPLLRFSGGGCFTRRNEGAIRHAAFLCAPDVATVEVNRGNEGRMADVSEGPGWISMIWEEGREPSVRALDPELSTLATLSAAELTGYLSPPPE